MTSHFYKGRPLVPYLLSEYAETRIRADIKPSASADFNHLIKGMHVKQAVGEARFYELLNSLDYRNLFLVIRDIIALETRPDPERLAYLLLVRDEYDSRLEESTKGVLSPEKRTYRCLDVKGHHLLLIVDEVDYQEDLKDRRINLLGGYPHCAPFGRIHRYIAKKLFGDIESFDIDHRNRVIFDARRQNLRKCTQSQNAFNRRLPSTNQSGYKGVNQVKGGAYTAGIRVDGKNAFIARFSNARDAAIAYDIYARKYHGDFARLNVPDVSDEEIQRVKEAITSNKTRKQASSRFYGVSKRESKGGKIWNASFTYRLQRYNLGLFETEEDAALAVDNKLKELGHLSKLNFNRPIEDMISIDTPWPKQMRRKRETKVA